MKKLALAFLFTISIGVKAQEVINLTTPITTPNTTQCNLNKLVIEPSIGNLSQGQITVYLVGTNNEIYTKVYNSSTSPTGASLISSLNTSNNSVTSLIKRTYNQLIASGICVGTVTGSPQ